MKIRRAVVNALIAHARADAPLECCGLLIGSGEQIEESCPAENLRRSATRFEVDPAAHFAAIRTARQSNREVLGAYHSHPASPPIPSETDVREATDPAFVHVIVSLTPAPEVRAYRINGNTVDALELEVVDA
jgi:proteasome lid subunit RPN8/RPN11